ncbi:MAG: hypothetical protein ACI8WT_003865 [Clostridium sp.]|jgi:hypothetical protein
MINDLLKCKNGSLVSIPSVPVVAPAAINRLVTLSLNTKDFCNPCIKFEFSTNLVTNLGIVEEVQESVTVTFQLYKLCRGEITPVAIGSSGVYSLSNLSAEFELVTANFASFIICDCDCDCDRDTDTCCSYYVQASTIGTGTASIIFNNPTLSALVVDNQRHCC